MYEQMGWCSLTTADNELWSVVSRRFDSMKLSPRGESYLEGKPAMHLCIPKDRGVFYSTYRDALINYSVRIVENAPKILQCRKIFCGEREGGGGRCVYAPRKLLREYALCYCAATRRFPAKTLIHCMPRMNFITRGLNKTNWRYFPKYPTKNVMHPNQLRNNI